MSGIETAIEPKTAEQQCEKNIGETTDPNRKECFPLTTQILAMIFGFIGFINSLTAAIGCEFFSVTSPILARHYGSYGLFKYHLIGGWDEDETWSISCMKYPSSAPVIDDVTEITQYQAAYVVTEGGSFEPAQAMGVLSATLSGVAMVASFSMLFLKFPRWAFKSLSGLYFVCFVTELLTFLILDNDSCNGDMNAMILNESDMDIGITCTLAADAINAIVASIFFIVLGILLLVCPAPKNSACSGDQSCCCCCDNSAVASQVAPPQVLPTTMPATAEKPIDPEKCIFDE